MDPAPRPAVTAVEFRLPMPPSTNALYRNVSATEGSSQLHAALSYAAGQRRRSI